MNRFAVKGRTLIDLKEKREYRLQKYRIERRSGVMWFVREIAGKAHWVEVRAPYGSKSLYLKAPRLRYGQWLRYPWGLIQVGGRVYHY